MNRDPIDDLLDHPAPLPDDGFTLRVMAALPPAGHASRPIDRWLPPLAAAIAAAVLAPGLVALAGALAEGSALLGGGLTRAFASGAGTLPIPVALLASAAALGAAAVGSWLVTEP